MAETIHDRPKQGPGSPPKNEAQADRPVGPTPHPAGEDDMREPRPESTSGPLTTHQHTDETQAPDRQGLPELESPAGTASAHEHAAAGGAVPRKTWYWIGGAALFVLVLIAIF